MALIFSELTPEEQVAAIFIGYYDRAPAVPGLNQYVADFAAGQTPADVARSFVMQNETLILYPSLDDETISQADAEQLVTDIFNNLFNRDPAGIEEGTNPWVQQLVDGTTEVGQVILNIMSGAQGDDLAILQNKIEVATAYVQAADAGGVDGTGSLKDTILDNIDGTQDSVTSAIVAIEAAFPEEPVSNPGGTFTLKVGVDTPENTENDDLFVAQISQSSFGGVSNTLATGDMIDGGAGNDRLMANLTSEFVGSNVIDLTDIHALIKNVEKIDFRATDLGDADGETSHTVIVDGGVVGSDGVYFNGILGHKEIGSYYSDGDLKIENLTTYDSNGSARNTSDITIKMAYTDNFNSDDDASDLVVLFDNDYLLSGQVEQGFADFFVLDQDAELRLLTGGEAEGRLDDLDKNGIQFRIDTNGDGVVNSDDDLITVAFADDLIVNDQINTHQEFRDALQDPLQDLIDAGVLPEGTTIELFEYTQVVQDDQGRNANQAVLDDGSFSNLIPAVRVELGNDAEVVAVGFATPDTEVPPFNFFGRIKNEFEQDDQPITIDIDLEKAGRGGEGGNLIVGGKSANVPAGIAGGIEVFNVNVMGGSELPSWIGSLNSTLDTLDQVYVTTDEAVAGSGDVANLTIGEIGGAEGINETTINGGETDVRYFDSTDFEGNLTAFANLDEFGNGAHSYLLGGGDDRLSITFGDTGVSTVTNPFDVGTGDSGDNAKFGGAAGDSLTINTGAGDDTLLLDSAVFETTTTGGADLEFLDIETGAGDDIVFYNTDNANDGPLVGPNGSNSGDTTFGDGASISTSGGEDRIYMNDGDSDFIELDFSGLLDQDNFQFFGASLQVEMDGVLSEWVDISFDSSSYTTSREDIRDAIVAAFASNSALEGMIEIVELADGSLQARSLVSGGSTFSVDLEGPVANAALIDNTAGNASDFQATSSDGGSDEPTTGDDGGWDLLTGGQSTINQVGLSQLANAWNAWHPGSTAFDDLDDTSPDFGSDDVGTDTFIEDVTTFLDVMADRANALDFAGALNGPTGNVSDDNVINAGGNDDLIVLTDTDVGSTTDNTEDGNGNVVEFTGQFGWDTIVNFTSDGLATAVDGVNDNDILDFTSYLDAAADARGTSVGTQDERVDEAVPFTFINLMGGDSGATDVDHNQIRLMEFSEIWEDLETDTTGSGPSHFDGLTAADVDAWLELTFSDDGGTTAVPGGETGGTGLGNNFLILVGKDGDIEIEYDGDIATAVDTAHADNQFWAFEATVSAYDEDDAADDNYDFTVTFLGGVDLADTDITGLSPDDFGVSLFT